MIKKIRSYLNNITNNSFIEITDIVKNENSVDVKFETSPDIDHLFRQKHQNIEYLKFDYNLKDCPDSICVIPTISNLLPIVWFFDLKLTVNELDNVFYENIEEIKKGYEQMFPFIDFKGKITVRKLVDNSYVPEDNSVLLFSQGLDSLNSFVNHSDENLHLTTLHGSDIPLNETEGLENLTRSVDKFASDYNCENSFIKSTFKKCLKLKALNDSLPDTMKKNWWHQFQHGIAILSHAVIIAYAKKSRYIYIASSHSDAYAKSINVDYVPCASSPIIDNRFRFASCRIIHDGYEYQRIDKLRNVIDFSKANKPIKLRVCYTEYGGTNCSRCEKCSRSIFGLIGLGENPNDYGFDVSDDTLLQIKDSLDNLLEGKETKGWSKNGYRAPHWINIQKVFQENRHEFEDNEAISWILYYDFSN